MLHNDLSFCHIILQQCYRTADCDMDHIQRGKCPPERLHAVVDLVLWRSWNLLRAVGVGQKGYQDNGQWHHQPHPIQVCMMLVFNRVTTFVTLCSCQARNQLGTPGGVKSFLRGPQIFKLRPIVSLCLTHFSRGENNFPGKDLPPSVPPLLRVWQLVGIFVICGLFRSYVLPDRLLHEADKVSCRMICLLCAGHRVHPSLHIDRSCHVSVDK